MASSDFTAHPKTSEASGVEPTFVEKKKKMMIHNAERETYLCFTVVTVSAATLVVMCLAADSSPVHMVAKPRQITQNKHLSHIFMYSAGPELCTINF